MHEYFQTQLGVSCCLIVSWWSNHCNVQVLLIVKKSTWEYLGWDGGGIVGNQYLSGLETQDIHAHVIRKISQTPLPSSGSTL